MFFKLITFAFILNRFIKISFLLIAGVLAVHETHGQYEKERDATIPLEYFYIKRKGGGPLRFLFSKVHLSLSTGVGQTYFNHKFEGYGILQNPNSAPVIFNSGQPATGYSNWFNTVTPANSSAAPGAFMVNSDTTAIGFRSRALNIPLKATLHIEYDRYRIGGGYSIEYMRIGDFNPISYKNDISSFSPENQNGMVKKYFLMLGGMLYRYYEYSLVLDLNIGGYNLGNTFDRSLIQKGAYFNLGLTGERQLSEYFRLFVRPSFEFKSYNLSIPESGNSITHRFNAFYLNVGVTYRLPELRRCPLKNCKAQITHAHGNREYRSRMHPFYKKQNPHYGENYPTLIKYKGKNKKKLNPY